MSKRLDLAQIIQNLVEETLNKKAKFKTDGGSSDGAYISKYCDDIAEFGLVNKTAHKYNESASIESLKDLELMYSKLIKYFSSN